MTLPWRESTGPRLAPVAAGLDPTGAVVPERLVGPALRARLRPVRRRGAGERCRRERPQQPGAGGGPLQERAATSRAISEDGGQMPMESRSRRGRERRAARGRVPHRRVNPLWRASERHALEPDDPATIGPGTPDRQGKRRIEVAPLRGRSVLLRLARACDPLLPHRRPAPVAPGARGARGAMMRRGDRAALVRLAVGHILPSKDAYLALEKSAIETAQLRDCLAQSAGRRRHRSVRRLAGPAPGCWLHLPLSPFP